MFGKVTLDNKKEYELLSLKNTELSLKTKDFDFATPIRGKFKINGFTQDIGFTGFVSDKNINILKIKFIVEKNKELMLKGAQAHIKDYYESKLSKQNA